jgi:hypothetical protein
MSLLDTASLVVTPNGTKASKLYSVVPSDGAGDLDVTRATTATRVNSSGLIESVASNVPRLDYTNGTCPSILVEPQRTNLVTYSEDFTNASWLGSATKTANTAISPSGVLNADSLIEVSSSVIQSAASATINFVSGTAYTMTVFAKNQPSGRGFVQLTGYALGSGSSNVYANFNLNTGVVGNQSGGSSKIEALANGWYRCSFTFTCGNTITERYNVCLISSMSATAFENYTGDTSKGIYVWGAQLEAGSYATSYIPTTSASVTRNADVISKTGISSLIGQTEGTMFVDFYNDGISQFNSCSISNGLYDDAVYFEMYLGNMYGVIWDSGAQQFAFNAGALSIGRHKMAIGYKANDTVFYIDGVLKYTDTSLTIPTTSRLDVGALASATIGKTQTNLTALWKTRLTNTQLAQLTTI